MCLFDNNPNARGLVCRGYLPLTPVIAASLNPALRRDATSYPINVASHEVPLFSPETAETLATVNLGAKFMCRGLAESAAERLPSAVEEPGKAPARRVGVRVTHAPMVRLTLGLGFGRMSGAFNCAEREEYQMLRWMRRGCRRSPDHAYDASRWCCNPNNWREYSLYGMTLHSSGMCI